VRGVYPTFVGFRPTMVGDAQPSKPFARLKTVNRIVAIAVIVTSLGTAWPGPECEAGIFTEDDVQAAAMSATSVESRHVFRVEWAISAAGSGRSRISGYVYNGSADTASNVQLRFSELGAEGQTVASMVGPVLARVPGHGRARFDVQVSGAGSASYQVAVAAFSFDFSAQRS